MMKFSKKKWLFACGLICGFLPFISDVYAVSKLDFPAPITDTADKIATTKNKIETFYNTTLETLNAKVEQATGREGAMIFKYIEDNSASIISSAARGQFLSADFTGSGMWDAVKTQLGDAKIDFMRTKNQLDKYTQAREQQKLDRRNAMQRELAALRSEYEALNVKLKEEQEKTGAISNPEEAQRLIELDERIAKLTTEVESVMQEDVTEEEAYKKMRAELDTQQNKINKLARLTSADEAVRELGTQSLKLFETTTDDEETEAAYETGVNKFFLGKNEPENSDTIERIMRNRKQEYYKAVVNSLETSIRTQTSIEEIQERSLACTDAATEIAQGIFGAAGMRVCVELQNAKVAARYMELLLADIRLTTTAEMQSWHDKYRLEDYDKDFTKFNLDNYVVKEEHLLKRLERKAVDAVTDRTFNVDLPSF